VPRVRPVIGLLLQVWRLIRAVGRMIATPEGRALVILASTQVLAGTVFYTLAEGWRWLDSLYFCVITLTTIGLGDLTPQTDLGKIFTIVYALVGVGILAAFVTVLATQLDLGRSGLRRRSARANPSPDADPSSSVDD
jgi:voltage-gated potassium channel